jgi:uncharacterized protein (DUF2147 family)
VKVPCVRRRRSPRPLLLSLLLTALPFGLSAAADDTDWASPSGLWQPLDSHGKPMGLIRIYEDRGRFFGSIERSSPSDDPNEKCTHCTDERRNQPIIGLVLMRNLHLENGEYVGGDILDPDTGHIYGCKFHLVDGGRRLIMRGYLGISLLGRSQVWQRVTTARR